MKNKTNEFNLPDRYEPYTDKYFLRTKEVLEAEGINPWVRGQVMIRKGPGQIYGVNEALAILEKYTPLVANGGKVYALKEGANYNPKDTFMLIEGRIQDFVALETMYLGVTSGETTFANDKTGINLNEIRKNMAEVVKAAENRPIIYMGARHHRYDLDEAINRAVFEAGATDTSTDIGALTVGKLGVGTTPHVLENMMAYQYGKENAVPQTMLAFDRVIDKKVPRIILVDYRNREITDALVTAKLMNGRLNGVRIDTCGENVAEGAIATPDYFALEKLTGKKIVVPKEDEKYWFGKGVTITGVYALDKALKENGFTNLKKVLSSGFANANKVNAFVRAENILGVKLFDTLGVGQVFQSRATKMDIVAVGKDENNLVPIAKVGRFYRPNPNLELRLGGKA